MLVKDWPTDGPVLGSPGSMLEMQILWYHLRPIQSLSRVGLIEISIVVGKGVTLPVYKDEVIALSASVPWP